MRCTISELFYSARENFCCTGHATRSIDRGETNVKNARSEKVKKPKNPTDFSWEFCDTKSLRMSFKQ